MNVKIRKQGDVAIVTLPGRLVYGEREGILKEATDTLLQEGFLRFLLDVEKVTFMDSSGLVELVGTYKRVVAKGDFEVLAERQRRLLRVHLGADVPAGLARLRDLIRAALA